MIFLLGGLVVSLPSPVRAEFAVQVYMPGLDWPVAIDFSPDGRIFYAELWTGNVRIIEDGVLLPSPYYTITNVSTFEGAGFLGLALDPDFPTTSYVYAYYTFDDSANNRVFNRIIRLNGSGNTGTFDRVLIDRIHGEFIHNGGVIGFGPDRKLYAVTGDATSPAGAQQLIGLPGKSLRLNPDGSIPDDNPFVGNTSVNPYVFTYGHRNMFGLAFNPTTGAVYASENGPECNDEVNLLLPGRNYGWGPTETCATPPPAPLNTNQDGPTPVLPLIWYTPQIAPTNMAIYSGEMFPKFEGDIILGSWNAQSLRRLDLEPPLYDSVVSDSVLVRMPEGILDVAVGPDDAIWFTTPSGIFRFYYIPRPPTAALTVSSRTANPMEMVSFDGSDSYDVDGSIIEYRWDFGDGNTGSGVTANHMYAIPGEYPVTLTVIDDDLLLGSALMHVKVNAVPLARFTVTSREAQIGQAIMFDGRGSVDIDGTIVSYHWDFGDGSAAGGESAEHAFGSKGSFVVTLTVIDNDGASRKLSLPVLIANRPPSIAGVNPSRSSVNMDVSGVETFRIFAWDPDGDPISFVWSVNGSIAQGDVPTFYFSPPAPGEYHIQVLASDGEASIVQEWTVIVESRALAPAIPVDALAAFLLLTLLAAIAVVLSRRGRSPER